MTIEAIAVDDAARCVPGIPRDTAGPIFREPWEAQAFAMAVTLQARGLFGWDEWAAMLGEEIAAAQRAGDPDRGDTYYRHWLSTLERMAARKGLTDPDMLAGYGAAWGRAAARTPHGSPIVITAADFAAD